MRRLLLLWLVGCSIREPQPVSVKAEPTPPAPSPSVVASTPGAPPPATASAAASASPPTCDQECKQLSDACDKGCPPLEGGRGCLKKCGCKWIGCQRTCADSGKVDFTCH